MHHWRQPGRAGSDEPSQETCLSGFPRRPREREGSGPGVNKLPPFETRGGFFRVRPERRYIEKAVFNETRRNAIERRFEVLKKASKITVALVVATVLAVLAGCGGGGGGTDAKISFTDDSGRKIVLSEPADRVVSLAPSNTEIIFWLGAEEKLVGVTTFCDYPAAAKKKPKIGDFATPNIEKIAAADPQVVFATGGLQDSVVKSLTGLGINVIAFDPTTVDGVMQDIRRTAQVLGVEDEASSKLEALEKRVAEVRDKAEGLEDRNVFFEIYNQPLTTAGGGTLIDSMISDAGALNPGAAAGGGFPQFSEEQLFNDDPYAYVAIKGSMQDPKGVSERPGFDRLTAVKDGRVFIVDDNLFVRSGPRIVDGLEALAMIAHPEEFGEYQDGAE
jgi:cobalamin transport system substrate-binding protein